MAKLTKPNIVMNLDGTVSATSYDPNASRFTWYAVELLSYNVGFGYYPPDVVSMTNTAETVEPDTDYTNTVFITDTYKGIIIFNNFKLFDTVTTMDVTDEFVTKVADNMYRIVIPNISSDYMVSFETIRLTYTITSSLSNCVSSMYDESYTAGNALSWTITAAEGYTFDGGTYALTVGGVDITSTGMVLNDDKTKFTMLVTSAQAIGDIVYVANAVESGQERLVAPVIVMGTDGDTLVITNVDNATSYDVYIDNVLTTNVNRAGYNIYVYNAQGSDSTNYTTYGVIIGGEQNGKQFYVSNDGFYYDGVLMTTTLKVEGAYYIKLTGGPDDGQSYSYAYSIGGDKIDAYDAGVTLDVGDMTYLEIYYGYYGGGPV